MIERMARNGGKSWPVLLSEAEADIDRYLRFSTVTVLSATSSPTSIARCPFDCTSVRPAVYDHGLRPRTLYMACTLVRRGAMHENIEMAARYVLNEYTKASAYVDAEALLTRGCPITKLPVQNNKNASQRLVFRASQSTYYHDFRSAQYALTWTHAPS